MRMGKPTAWAATIRVPPIGSMMIRTWNTAAEVSMGWTEIPYNIPNLRVENGKARAHIRIGWLRSVAHIYHAFAIQTFTDELATASGRDMPTIYWK